MEKISLRIGGVPEHFNLPWHLALEEKKFEEAGIDLHWQDYGGGTGAMAKDVRESKLDMALLLTEGAVADIIKGGNYRIAGLYVQSPLIWGIHVHQEAPYQQVNELEGKTFAISRYGSGSHLMAFVNARQQGWKPEELKFSVVGDLDGARAALANQEADTFMWEKFTTKPLVDRGEWRRAGECPTPWPCFVLVVSEEAMKEKKDAVQKVLEIVRKSCRELKEHPQAVSMLAQRYQLKPEDAATWFRDVQWAPDNSIETGMLEQVMQTLHQLGLIEQVQEPTFLCNELCQLK
jgi:sulfonate transport system substrate-binding protein